jgi:hypothetical protein
MALVAVPVPVTRAQARLFWEAATSQGSNPTSTFRHVYDIHGNFFQRGNALGFIKMRAVVIFSRTEAARMLFGVDCTRPSASGYRQDRIRTVLSDFFSLVVGFSKARVSDYASVQGVRDFVPDSFALYSGWMAAIASPDFCGLRHKWITMEAIEKQQENQKREMEMLEVASSAEATLLEVLVREMIDEGVGAFMEIQMAEKALNKTDASVGAEVRTTETETETELRVVMEDLERGLKMARAGKLEFDESSVHIFCTKGAFKTILKKRTQGKTSGQVDGYVIAMQGKKKTLRSKVDIRKYFGV